MQKNKNKKRIANEREKKKNCEQMRKNVKP